MLPPPGATGPTMGNCRPSGAYLVMPLLIVSMGGEMIYILEQRLEAQKISEVKGQKVLYDVIRSMFFPRFIQELFKPQEIFSMSSTRQIFDRLAHSSIMRLNESSMDKLLDLMTMGYKYQFLSCSCAEELIDVTLNHIDACKRIAANNQEILNLILQCEQLIHDCYDDMTIHDYRELRMTLASFFQDRKVKVSLFLQDDTQNYDGSIVVAMNGALPFNTLPTGTITYLQQDLRQDHLILATTNLYYINERRTTRVNRHGDNWTQLGKNLYSKERKNKLKDGGKGGEDKGAEEAKSPKNNAQNAVGQLNHLASLIQVRPADGGDGELLKFDNFFGNDIWIVKSDTGGANPDDVRNEVKISNAYTDHQKQIDTLRNDFDNLNVGGGGNVNQEEQDLLDLLG